MFELASKSLMIFKNMALLVDQIIESDLKKEFPKHCNSLKMSLDSLNIIKTEIPPRLMMKF